MGDGDAVNPADGTGDELRVTPVGVGAGYARIGEVQSAYLISGASTSVCLDLGAGALNALQAHVEPHALDALVISHCHPDHCVDLFALRVWMVWGPGRGERLRVIGPGDLRDRLTAFAGDDGWDDAFAFEPIGPEAMVGGLRLTFAEVPHSGPTHAIRVDCDGRSITYGADCRRNDDLPRLAAGTDVLIAECGDGDAAGASPVHMTGADAGATAAAAGARRLLLTHCYPEHDRNATIAAARFAFDGPVDWARQGETVVAE